jgi:hypothetical protein
MKKANTKQELMSLIEIYNGYLDEVPDRRIHVAILFWGRGAKNELYYTETFDPPKNGAHKTTLIKTKHSTYKNAMESLHEMMGLIFKLVNGA